MSEEHTLGGPGAPSPFGRAPLDRGPLARELLRLRCLQLDTASLEEITAYDRAATAAAEARLHAHAAEVGDLPPERPAPARLLLTWYLSGRSAFCRAALLALAAEFRRSAAPPPVIALTPEPPETARRTSADLALPFPAVHDDGRNAEEFGIRYAAPLEFAELLGLATADPSPGSSETQPPEPRGVLLPLPATFLIEGGRISGRFVHPDSRYRAEPAEFLRA
ncbi:MAG: hypothetical protein R6W94_00190 [Spirochaetia bacterium]